MLKKQILGILIIFCSSYTLAETTTKPLKGCFSHWLPYSYINEKGSLVGFSIDIYKEALKRAGIHVVFSELPWSRCKRSVEHGKVDVAVDGGIRIKNAVSSNLRPIPWVLALWTNHKYKNDKFTGFNHLKSKEVGYVRNYEYPKSFLNNQEVTLSPVNDDLEGLRMLDHERFSYFYGDLVNSRYLKAKYELSIYPMLPVVDVRFLDLTFHHTLLDEQASYKAALQTLYDDGTIEAAYKTYLGSNYQEIINTDSN